MIARPDTPLPAPLGHAVEFEIPRPVASSKNRRRNFARGKFLTKKGKMATRIVSLLSEQAEDDTTLIRKLAEDAAGGAVFGPDDALSLSYVHDIETDRLTVRVEKIGTLPTKGRRGTKRDVHGMLETIADALQGVLYPNDNQVESGSFARRRS